MKKIGKDKISHFIVSLVIAFALSTLLANVAFLIWPDSAGARVTAAYVAAFVLATCVGVWKECRDARQPGNHFCLGDLVADVLGSAFGALGALVSYLL